MSIERSVAGTLKLTSESYEVGYSTRYRNLTLEQIQEWCIEALVNGAKPTAEVGVYHSSLGGSWLTVSIPATFEPIPDIPNAGRNAALNRKMVFIAAGAVTVAILLLLLLVTVLVVH